MSGLLNSLKNLAGSSKQSTGEGDMRFSVSPKGGACGWAEWLKAMRLVARLPTGIPPEFRKKLWLTLAEQHLKVKGVDWTRAERTCFSEWTNPDDTELGVQIVKDLHRTGCSLFCGTEGRENQAVLKRVLLAYARWNKAVGYCQGFNMLAALILEVMDRSESDSLKVMIYLIEAVLPEGYFANNLRGLSVDMAVFRDLLKLRLPRLSAHLEKLQKGAAEGSCYEPPLTNVFTMQWFLTLFCNCLPRNTVLRVWDLVFLEGDEILLTTALAIWDTLQDRILVVESADEFYSVMGELARQTLEAPPATSEALLVRAAQLGPVPELPRLRDKHRYNITPWAHSVQSAAKKGLRMFYSEDETDSSDDGDKLAITTAYGLQAGGRGRGALMAAGVFGHPDREKLALDISALKQQYARLRERQRQAHIILAAACARQPSVGATSGHGPISVNHLLLGKSAIVSARGRRLGPPQGAIPPSRAQKINKSSSKAQCITPSKSETLHWKDENQKKTVQRRDSIKWRDVKQMPLQGDEPDEEPEEEDGKLVTESEVNEILQTSMRSRRKSESSSYSECSESSTSTSLCDEPNRMSDFDSELSDNFTGNTDDVFKEVDNDKTSVENVDKDNSDKIESIGDNDSNNEFGSYVQEFEELLDRTNNIEKEEDRLCSKENPDDESASKLENSVKGFEVNVVKDTSDKIESIDDNDSNNEFGSYMLEFEELLVRTNNIENEEDRLCSKETLDDESASKFENYAKGFEVNVDKDTSDKIESIDDNDRNNEFGSYVQEFEELLDRTNNIEIEEDRLCSKETPEDESASKFENYAKRFEVLLDNTNQIADDQQCIKDDSPDDKENSEFVNYLQEFDVHLGSSKIDSDDDQPSIKSSEKKDPLTDDIKYQNTDSDFNEFVDSNRGKPLRNYLDEFRKADDAIKNERSWEEEESLQNEFMEKTSDIAEDDCSIKLDKNGEIDDEQDQEKEQSFWDHSDKTDIKPFVYPDFRSNSCERSVSSSVSSISPILRYAAECAEGSPSFLCYKSPMRAESRVTSAFVEDEKPLVLTIDKYFEHSPEFFGARKSGTYISSDEDDDAYLSKTKIISLDEVEKSVINLEEIYTNNEYEKIEVSLEDKSFKIIEEDKEIVSSSNPYSLKENLSFYEVPSTFVDKKSSPISPEELKNVFSKLPFENNTEHVKYNVLEKTKSEELPHDQKRAFSLLDEEIEAIRSQSGRRNSERALRIIQENSKILHRILVNQVNKTSSKDYLQEETSESLADEMNQRERRDLRFHDYKYAKTLPSPRSASLDESLQRKNKEFTYVPGLLSFDLDNKTPVKSKETTPIVIDKKFIDSTTKQIVTPTSSGTLTPLHDKNKSEEQNVVHPVDENKTDMFGWENKGFSANQHIKSYYKHEFPTTKTYSHDIITSYIDKSKTMYEYESKKITEFKTPDSEKKYHHKTSPKDEVELHLNPMSYTKPKSPSKEKTLSFSSIVEPTEYSSKDFSESWKIENNNSLNDSYNVSSPYKYSDNIDVISKPIHKFTDSALSRINDTLSWAPETSPLENNIKPDGSKYETSQSSDLCVVSSSMSFSFDPSVEDHPSSKPPTFNSSDTLCQLTSLDQVSTPISPKVTAFSLPKDTVGISQKELSMELDKFRLPSEESSIIQGSLTDTESGCISSLKTPTSPLSYPDKSHSLKSPDTTFNPFPVKSSYRQPKELGLRLGLYKDPLKSPSK